MKSRRFCGIVWAVLKNIGGSMDYSYLDLLCYFFIYSFCGWVAEVAVISAKEHAFKNRGFFNLPFCISYGLVMDILIILLPSTDGNILFFFLVSTAVSSVITYISGSVSKRISGRVIWDYQVNNLFAGRKRAFFFGLAQGLVFMFSVLLFHPLIYLLISVLPRIIKIIGCGVVIAALLFDFAIIIIAMRKRRSYEEIDELIARQRTGKVRMGERIAARVWRRLAKAYPNMQTDSAEKSGDGGTLPEGGGAGSAEEESAQADAAASAGEKSAREDVTAPAGEAVFAKGMCFFKLVWVFLIMSLIGDIFETFFVYLRFGTVMSRSSFIYGPFSAVWGLGAMALTVVLQRLAGREDRHVFLAGCLLGGVYEYACSVITEVFLGTTFWDYSDLPFNFGGRTNLLFCLFWGLLSVWWIKWAFPRISAGIEKIPVIAGEIATWFIVIFFILDGILSVSILARYSARAADPSADNVIEVYLDENYPDEVVEERWQNLVLSE